MLRIIVTYLARPISRWLLRTVSFESPWERFVSPVPMGVYGLGARHDFRWYFEGESTVGVRSLEEMTEWLLGCEYASDPDLFQEADYWQHPCSFEQLRRGDCEDFSLWVWRKLIRLGYDAEFVAGRCVHPGCSRTGLGHTWVIFRHNRTTYLFDPTIRDRDQMIRPLAEVHYEYVPEVSIDRRFTRYAYAGYSLKWRDQADASPRSTAVALPQVG